MTFWLIYKGSFRCFEFWNLTWRLLRSYLNSPTNWNRLKFIKKTENKTGMQSRRTLVALETELGPISFQKKKVPRTLPYLAYEKLQHWNQKFFIKSKTTT